MRKYIHILSVLKAYYLLVEEVTVASIYCDLNTDCEMCDISPPDGNVIKVLIG